MLDGVKPHLMVTDPPYGVDYDPAWREPRRRQLQAPGKTGKVLNDDRADWREAWALFPGDVAYCLARRPFASCRADSLEACGFAIRAQIIWDKTGCVIGRGDYHWQHEPAGMRCGKARTGHWAGDRKQSTLWRIPHREVGHGHGTEKPVECMRRPIENNSSPGQAVYEPFCGSGTTIIAAEMTGRVCHAIELEPGLCRCGRQPLAGLSPATRPSWRATAALCRVGTLRAGDARPVAASSIAAEAAEALSQADAARRRAHAGDPAQVPGLLRAISRRGRECSDAAPALVAVRLGRDPYPAAAASRGRSGKSSAWAALGPDSSLANPPPDGVPEASHPVNAEV